MEFYNVRVHCALAHRDKIVIDFPSFLACNVTDLCKVRRLTRAHLLERPFMDGMADKDTIS